MVYEVKNLSFSYKTKKTLHELNFSIRQGDFMTIIGPNGSGKTTLLNLLTGFFKPQNGDIYFNGKSLQSYNIKSLAKKIAVVPQDVSIRFPFTCLEVVMMGRAPYKDRVKQLSDRDLEIVYQSMEKTDTLQYTDALINEISGGEKQRVIFAKALAQTPEVLFLDEAFSSMDIYYSVKFLNLLKNLTADNGITVVSIMHDLNMADTYSDTILALNDGRVAGWGCREEVMEPKLINSLFNINVEKTGSRGLVVLPQL